ncbi:IclR family transcriptional regulator [Herbaspirillum lusitanum]|uniref:IclR family transcriptional regulator n=1 Tax=Herbaspirillum lusitanum TaxID=213312 RepID=A0ABW9AFT9_9BURK
MDATDTPSIVDRVLHVLACVAKAGRPISAKQIAAQVALPLSTVYRHLAALKKWGLLQEHMDSGLFEPGPTGVQLAWGFDQNSNLISQSREEISALVARTGESVGLLVYINGQMVCIAMEEADQPLRCSFVKGRAHSMFKGASAKSLLAFLPRSLQQRLIDTEYAGAPQEGEALHAQMAEVRKRGYAISESEVDFGVWGVSAPLLSHNGRLEGTLTLMAPALRVGEREAELIRLTRETAERICNRF